MAQILASATRTISARPDHVLAVLRDYREARPKLLGESHSDYRVEEGGEGAGTVFAYRFSAGRRERDFRLRVEESGSTLIERDQRSSFVQSWSVTDTATGSTVTVQATWNASGGIGGFFERLFAPLAMRRMYGQMLERLAAAAQAAQQRAA